MNKKKNIENTTGTGALKVPGDPKPGNVKYASLSFSEALVFLKYGRKVARQGWNGKGMWLGLQTPDAHSKMTLPYIYMSTVIGDLVPWLASQTDILAEDWTTLE